jgi:hypothetical protein
MMESFLYSISALVLATQKTNGFECEEVKFRWSQMRAATV